MQGESMLTYRETERGKHSEARGPWSSHVAVVWKEKAT